MLIKIIKFILALFNKQPQIVNTTEEQIEPKKESNKKELKPMEAFKIKGVELYTQFDNKYKRFITCFPTSTSMAINYCLSLKKLNKVAVGCSEKMQLEDYVYQIIYEDETKKHFMNKHGAKWWGWQYKRHTVAAVNEYIFNLLMQKHGFMSGFKTDMTYEHYCSTIATTKLPIVLSGNFKSVSKIGGHIVCGIGFNKIGMKEVIAHDPFGNALDGYPPLDAETRMEKGFEVTYSTKFFTKDKNGSMWGLIIERR